MIPPKPTALKEFEGNPGKRALNEAEPKPDSLTDLSPPTWLTKEVSLLYRDDLDHHEVAVNIWNHLAPKLDRLGILTELDVNVLGRYCEVFARWLKCRAFIDKNGEAHPVYDYRWEPQPNGAKPVLKKTLKYMRPFPQFGMYATLLAQMQKLENELGIGAAGRSRISALVKPKTELEKNADQTKSSSPFNYAARDGIRLIKKPA